MLHSTSTGFNSSPSTSSSPSAPVLLSRASPSVWVLTLSSPPDNRLRPPLLACLGDHLDTIEAQWRAEGGGERDPLNPKGTAKPGAVVLTSGIERFFSNGLQYEDSINNRRFFQDVYDPVWYRLATFPLVTIGAINGHAFAGGMMLALACDFRIMTSGKGLMSMNELTFGSPLPNSFVAFFRHRIPPSTLRDLGMAKRFTQAELLKHGLIDATAPPDELHAKALEMAEREAKKIEGGSWGSIKQQLWHPVMLASEENRELVFPSEEGRRFWARMQEKGVTKESALRAKL